MTHPNYSQWPAEIQDQYDKTAETIKKHGHTIKGIKDLRLGLAYTLGASFSTGAEFLSFFPLGGKGLSIIGGIMNQIIRLVQNGSLTLKSQILNDASIYYLPIGMVALIDDVKDMAESKWAGQLQRDAFLAEFSTEDHQLFLLLASDKDGNLPWEPECGNYWPDICPPPLVAIAQEILTGDDDFLMRKSKDDDDRSTTVRGVSYPLLAELSPQDMIEAYEMGVKEWSARFPKGNYELLLATLTSLFENEVVVTQVMNNNFMYFDINNIPESFKDDFPNDFFDPNDQIRSLFYNKKKEEDMKPDPLTPIHCIGFFLYAFGHVTDGEITYEEKEQIIKQLKIWSPEDVRPDFDSLISEIVDWYVDVFESGQSEMQKTVGFCAGNIKNTFDAQNPSTATMIKKQFVDALVEIAKVDGIIKDSEKAWINNICNVLDVDIPDV